jgi:hypothetical protein
MNGPPTALTYFDGVNKSGLSTTNQANTSGPALEVSIALILYYWRVAALSTLL